MPLQLSAAAAAASKLAPWQFRNGAATSGNGRSADGMMPLSPPLTPLPPPMPRFHPPTSSASHPSPYHLFMAAQYHQQQQQQNNPFLSRPQPPQQSTEVMEQLQRLLQWQLETQQRAAAVALQQQDLIRLAAASKIKEQEAAAASAAATAAAAIEQEKPLDVLNNDDEEEDAAAADEKLKKPSPEDMKRELEMVEDEMKESDEDTNVNVVKKEEGQEASPNEVKVDSSAAVAESLKTRLAMMKKLFELNGGASTAEEKAAATSVMELFMKQQQDLSAASSSSSEEKEKEGEWNQSGVAYEESLNSDGNDADDSQDGMMMSSAAQMSGPNPGGNFSLNSSNGGMSQSSAEDRKVRVRTLISEEQLAVLKGYYMLNPRPKREELDRIAAKIGHPFKVVKVWFQNSRARDRREGKVSSHHAGGSSGSALSSFLPFMNGGGQSPTPSSASTQQQQPSPFLNNNFPQSPSQLMAAAAAAAASGLFPRMPTNLPASTSLKMDVDESESKDNMSECNEDQPLDLSGKGSSPSVSPLSLPSQRSPTPHHLPLFTPSSFAPGSGLSAQFEQHFARAAAAGGGPKFPFPIPAAGSAFPTGFALDIYRFQEERNSTSSSSVGTSGADEEGHYPCTKCDKTFVKKSSLARHKFEHSGKFADLIPFYIFAITVFLSIRHPSLPLHRL
jgi:hypothetical protein